MRIGRFGLTLVELVVVLAIMALLSGMAVRTMNTAIEQVRYESTRVVLEQSRQAVLGSRRQASAETQASGFYSDCGRFPTDADELIEKPGNVIDRTVFSFDSDRDGVDDVSLTGGWNGPYLQPGINQTSLIDGWGRGFALTMNSGDWTITSSGSDGDSVVPEDGYAADLSAAVTSRETQGDIVCRIFAIDPQIGSRIDPSPGGLEQLGLLLYGTGYAGSIDGSVEEELIVVSNSGTFEHRKSNVFIGSMAVRAILWNDLDSDDVLDPGEVILKKSYVHYGSVSASSDVRFEMELR